MPGIGPTRPTYGVSCDFRAERPAQRVAGPAACPLPTPPRSGGREAEGLRRFLSAALPYAPVVTSERVPDWFDDVAGWLVTMSEGRFGLCRMLLWLRAEDDEEEADVVMPLCFTEYERSLPDAVRGSDRPFFAALWRCGFLPTQRPSRNTRAPLLLDP